MSENPYAPPSADVNIPRIEPQVPDAIIKNIRNAWIAALISASITLVFTLLAISGTSLLGFTVWEFFDVGLILGLTYGIYKKSRVCATLMLVYFVVSKILIYVDTGRLTGGFLALVFIYYYALGVQGTLEYHRHIKK